MSIIYNKSTRQFHLYNKNISYIFKILDDGELINLYCGKRIEDKEDFSYTIIKTDRPLAVYSKQNNGNYCLQNLKREYPDYGRGDFRTPSFEILQSDGSTITEFRYVSHNIYKGKKSLNGLPATYVENDDEAMTLEVNLIDKITDVLMVLSYTIFENCDVITRNTLFVNKGKETVILNKASSLNVDLNDSNYEMLTLSGAWARERKIISRPLAQGIQGVYSSRGASSSEHNPFVCLKRKDCSETSGEAFGFALVYSGNHAETVEVDTNNMTRVTLGINPDKFSWLLESEQSFQTPEAIMVYSSLGLNYMSQTFHKLFRSRLVRGVWRDKQRPVLVNNWETTGMNFTQDKIISMAKQAKNLGAELFVLDDGWFGGRDNDKRGLGDWYVTDFKKLPDGICGLSRKIKELGIDFGLWFEPEMVNEDSNLYRNHPDWIIKTPCREISVGRNQYVLDFANPDVVDDIYNQMVTILSTSEISYIKWDMNRYITEAYSVTLPNNRQGEVFHRYILGVYSLYERLIKKFPDILFESCASGGSRFDAGMLYYAPQGWLSDDTDAMERVRIQYGTSMLYPVSSMGAHVSIVPNQHVGRVTPFETRANVAMFGAFGYELDITALPDSEIEMIKSQITFFKKHRKLIQFGNFYRLISPFDNNVGSWMVVSDDKKEAIAGYYRYLAEPNVLSWFMKLQGLDDCTKYSISGFEGVFYGNELKNIGIHVENDTGCSSGKDFTSKLYYISRTE